MFIFIFLSFYKGCAFFFWHEKVADLEKEVENQKEHRLMYRRRLERRQDYLRHCLQIAQGNGFLDLILNEKDDGQ
jgi:hypothetical protein